VPRGIVLVPDGNGTGGRVGPLDDSQQGSGISQGRCRTIEHHRLDDDVRKPTLPKPLSSRTFALFVFVCLSVSVSL